jgi:hypothetical protein
MEEEIKIQHIANGKSYQMWFDSIKKAQKGEVIMYASLDGDVAIIDWKEYERLKKLDK